ncbi:Vacuolar protein sorting-associated protein 13 [Bienertia sinuspersici]
MGVRIWVECGWWCWFVGGGVVEGVVVRCWFVRPLNLKARGGQVNKIVEIHDVGIHCSHFEGSLDFMGANDAEENEFWQSAVTKSGKLEVDAPQYSITAELMNLVMTINPTQLEHILKFSDYICTCQLREKYGRYRPWDFPLSKKFKGWQKIWWQYAKDSVLSDVRKRLKKTSWSYLGQRLLSGVGPNGLLGELRCSVGSRCEGFRGVGGGSTVGVLWWWLAWKVWDGGFVGCNGGFEGCSGEFDCWVVLLWVVVRVGRSVVRKSKVVMGGVYRGVMTSSGVAGCGSAWPIDQEKLFELEQMEKDFDIDDILWFRSIAERELEDSLRLVSYEAKEGCTSTEKFPNDEAATGRARGWLNWLSRGVLGAGGTDDSSQFSGVVSDEVLKDICEATKFQPMPSVNIASDGLTFLFAVNFHITKMSLLLKSV